MFMAKMASPPKRRIQVKLTKTELDDFSSYLAEGIHTAFRKGSDHEAADRAWKAIRDLPQAEWGLVIDFVIYGIQPYLEETLLPGIIARVENIENK
jgi:hypothetical protein